MCLGGVPFSLAQLIANENERLESTNLENANLTQNGTERLGQTTKRPLVQTYETPCIYNIYHKRTSEQGKLGKIILLTTPLSFDPEK